MAALPGTCPVLSLTKGLDPADHAEESRRIPWIWRVAIAAGRRNDAAEIVRILDASVPADAQPLERWQAVAIGGGIINGITLADAWPGARVEGLLRDDPTRLARWRRAQSLRRTIDRRPDLIEARGGLGAADRDVLAEFGLDRGLPDTIFRPPQ